MITEKQKKFILDNLDILDVYSLESIIEDLIDNMSKDYASKLMFDMDDAGYDRTLEEFETVEKHRALIGEIDGIENVEPMTFPYVIYHATLREDEAKDTLTNEEVLANSKDTKANQVKVPKVVG